MVKGRRCIELYCSTMALFSLQVECERVDIPTGPKEVSPDCATTSDSEGDFVFPSLPPGIYTLVRWGITRHAYN